MSEAALDQLIELRKKSGFVAAVANVFLPGAGYAYCGRWIMGLFVFMIVLPLAALVWLGGVLFGVGIKILAGFYLVMVIDGFLSAGRYNRRMDTEMRLEHTLRQGGTPQRGFADSQGAPGENRDLATSDLPEIKNEPSVGQSHGDLGEFSGGYRSAPDQRDHHDDEPRKSRFRYASTLIAILLVLVAGWHWFAANHYEKKLTRNLSSYVGKNLPNASVSVDVHPLTNLIEIQLTRNVARTEAAFDFFGDALVEFVRQELEPKMERELSVLARRDVDLYAMLVPYQVSISIDKVRAPPAPPPSRMVQEIQRQLSARGYEPGPADGRLGARTRNAIVGFQRDHGLTEDGRATGDLLEMLRKE